MNISINWLDTFIGIGGAGIMITALIFFSLVWKQFKIENYSSIAIVCFASFFYMLSSAISKIVFFQFRTSQSSVEGFKVMELAGIFFLGIIPYFLSVNVHGPVKLLRLNRLLSFVGFSLFPIFILCAYVFPKTFLFDPYLVPSGTIEFKMGLVYMIAQLLLAMTILYALLVIFIDAYRWKSFSRMWSVQAGLLVCMLLDLSAVWKTLFGYYLDPFNTIVFSRILLGQLFLSIGLALGYFNHFLKQAQEVHKSHDALEASRNELQVMLYTDNLTGLRNRRAFIVDLEKILARKQMAGILLLDLDNFMEFNECFGDDSGDAILKSVSEELSAQIASDAILYRMGGDEFAAILTHISKSDELLVLANTLREISSVGFKAVEKIHSFGIAISLVMLPRDGDTTDIVLSNAYSAMHAAKENNTVCLYSDSFKRDSLLRISTIQLLREDLRGGMFRMVYQPIHNREGRVSSVEALLRWESINNHVPVGPDFFIPLLESSGLMPEMGELIIRLVLNDLGTQLRGAASFPVMSINLSAHQLKIDGLGVSIEMLFKQEGIPLKGIQFEVTESAFLDRAGVSVANLSYLRSRGCLIAMDDFGTGYSNLGYLRNLPIDKIKVDKSFVNSVPGDESAEGLLKAVYDIGKSYSMQLVAEGVETIKQRDFLLHLGFDEFQGFLYSQGLPCNDLLRYLDSVVVS